MTVKNKALPTEARPAAQNQNGPKSLIAKTTATLADRRRETRYPCNNSVEVRNLTNDGAVFSARMIEISRSGLRLETATSLSKGAHLEILMSKEVAIFGQVRHCRPAGEMYESGILIEEVYYASAAAEHVSAVDLAKYGSGEGLTIPEAIRVREHLAQCDSCRARMAAGNSSSQEPGKIAK